MINQLDVGTFTISGICLALVLYFIFHKRIHKEGRHTIAGRWVIAIAILIAILILVLPEIRLISPQHLP